MKKSLFVVLVLLVMVTGSLVCVRCASAPPAVSVDVLDMAHEVVNGMVRLKGGTFAMGSPLSEPGRDRDETQHQVTVSAFWIGQYEVTQEEYQALMGTNPSYFKGDTLPVENVTWYDAVKYCNALSRKEGLTPAYTVSGDNVTWNRNANGYRLPTEAEWEYACRAGTAAAYTFGDSIDSYDANYYAGSAGFYFGGTRPVGSYAPNAWGLYDTHGNVWEWCWDCYGSYPRGAQKDPPGADSGSYRVLRGGSWSSYSRFLRSAFRFYISPSYQINFIGFRLAHS